MKRKYIFLLCLFFLFKLSHAQSADLLSFQLNWEKETWQANTFEKSVLTFKQAVYPTEGETPFFSTQIEAKGEIELKIENLILETLSMEELSMLDTMYLSQQASSTINLSLKKTEIKEEIVYELLFLPFVKENNTLKKVKALDFLVEEKQSQQAKKSPFMHSFTENSKMAQGKWVKIKIPSTGIYKMTYQDIVNLGLDVNDFALYGYGGALQYEDFSKPKKDDLPQVPIYINKGKDGIFNAGDYILFYAQGPIAWEYDEYEAEFYHTTNLYSTHAYYFLASGVNESLKTIPLEEDVNLNGEIPINIQDFTERRVHEKDLINLARSGREFYGEEFNQTILARNISFSIPHLKIGEPVSVKFDAAAYSIADATPPSNFKVTLGQESTSIPAPNIPTIDFYTKGTIATKRFNVMPNSSLLDFRIQFIPTVSSAKGWLNYLRINAVRNLVMSGDELFFRTPLLRGNTYGKFILQTPNNVNLQVWDITDHNDIKEKKKIYDTDLNAYTFIAKSTDNTIKEYVAVDVSASYPKPEVVGSVANQNLHALNNAELVIISHADYVEQAQKLALAHLEKDNMSSLIVTPEQIYHEFSSGTPDATAYRWFLKMFHDRYKKGEASTSLKYLLLLGDGSYDNRQLLAFPDNSNKILTFQSYNSLIETNSYVTDDYFGFLDDIEGINPSADILDVGIGRIPVNTVQQATDVINKIITYINNENKGKWKNQLCFLADDGDDITHVGQADQVANKFADTHNEFEIIKLYLDAYNQQTTPSGSRYPEVREKLHSLLKNGILMLNYTGHGGTEGWTDERILTKEDVINMYNPNLALWVTATCDFSRFDSKEISAGEHVLFNPNGGGIALFTTTRTVYSGPNFTLNMKLADYIFRRDENNERLRLGDIMRQTKIALGNESNKLNFSLLGDPALMLNYPSFQVITDSINGLDIIEEEVAVGALDLVTISGHIEDNGLILEDFNGFVEVSVFDKSQDVNTLNNDGCTSRPNCGIYTYKDRSLLFSGKTKVENGYFNISFIVPKDINYSLGQAKITYYAADEENDKEAQGSFFDMQIGGTSSRYIDDEEGPEVDIYLNTPSFQSGDVVNESPLFVANVRDENGINIIGNGVGHDIVLMLNNQDWIVLNDYYQPDLGTYESGSVKYKFDNLESGKHSLTFRVWDLVNNSTSKTIDFFVKTGKTVDILDLYSYPNPASSETIFVLKHDRPDELLEINLQVLDLTGREMWSYKTSIYPMDNTTVITSWDLRSTRGDILKKGIYLYRIEVATSKEKLSTKTKKLMIF